VSAGDYPLVMELRQIVVATDGSGASVAAVEVGLELATAQQAKVTFVHFSPIANDLFEADPINGPTQQQIAAVDPVLGDASKKAMARGIAFELEIADEHGTDDIAGSIAGIALGKEADVIVVGTRGRGGLKSAVLGSVSHDLLKFASLPIVVVVHASEPD
jgi:nucleotide-binding universal stress UspA family protein